MTDTYDFGDGLVPAYKHTNGGGWVAHTAIVDDSAYVGPDARVYEDAVVYKNALITENAQIYGNVLVTDNAQVYGNAQIYGNAEVSGYAQVSGNTEVSGDSVVHGHITKGPLEREDNIRRHENMNTEIKIVDRFDLEQDIFKCWHLVDDLDQLIEMVMDRDASNDTISNVLIGLSALYGDRFQKLMSNFEELIANEKI